MEVVRERVPHHGEGAIMNAMWGPALDAEVAYRAEQLTATTRPRSTRAVTAGPAGAGAGSARARTGARQARTSRGWHLPGSGAWHAAR